MCARVTTRDHSRDVFFFGGLINHLFNQWPLTIYGCTNVLNMRFITSIRRCLFDVVKSNSFKDSTIQFMANFINMSFSLIFLIQTTIVSTTFRKYNLYIGRLAHLRLLWSRGPSSQVPVRPLPLWRMAEWSPGAMVKGVWRQTGDV